MLEFLLDDLRKACQSALTKQRRLMTLRVEAARGVWLNVTVTAFKFYSLVQRDWVQVGADALSKRFPQAKPMQKVTSPSVQKERVVKVAGVKAPEPAQPISNQPHAG